MTQDLRGCFGLMLIGPGAKLKNRRAALEIEWLLGKAAPTPTQERESGDVRSVALNLHLIVGRNENGWRQQHFPNNTIKHI